MLLLYSFVLLLRNDPHKFNIILFPCTNYLLPSYLLPHNQLHTFTLLYLWLAFIL